jgi:hypothetical protein
MQALDLQIISRRISMKIQLARSLTPWALREHRRKECAPYCVKALFLCNFRASYKQAHQSLFWRRLRLQSRAASFITETERAILVGRSRQNMARVEEYGQILGLVQTGGLD